MADPYTPPPVRVIVVVNWRRGTVHGITCDQAQAQQWCRDLVAEYGDPLAATQTVDLVNPEPEAGRLLPPGEPDLWQYALPASDQPDGVVPFEGRPRIVTPRMVRRPLRAVGPWQPVPTPTEEADRG